MNRILIVDDSSMARTLIRRSLEVCGFDELNVLEASNGVNAMEVLRNNPIDMVFTDLNMPEMDGEGLLKRIKSSPRLNHIPVVVISSKKSSATERKLIAEHAVAVLGKPIVLPELNDVLEQSLSIEKN